ncbi:alanine--tRNA ligase [candidate division KSB1 bacterium]|nr:alanine--tRNA ligase [candidate division KSB1 bacterium]
MKSNEIRNTFIRFFESKGHRFVPSSPVIPYNDPTLLFTNAGMNQFKNIFLGHETRAYTRVANSQKCMRVSGKHNDLEEVGVDTYHHTFFEMLGNWSFGDYYKKEAIQWAWELLTGIWKLPKDKLYATIYLDDDQAGEYWKQVTDIRHNHILKFGEKDNFWEMGETGPCGPCSEIHIDLGPERCDKTADKNHVCAVNAGCARYIELWNLVFIQFNREKDGSLVELPAKHVDTGMGFERVVAVLQNVDSNYGTDLFVPIIEKIGDLTNQKFRHNNDGVAHRVIADHIRALTFTIADGALPSNEGRGYVLRRLLRRAARFGRTLGMHEPFIYKIVPTVVGVMGEAFPEIKEKSKYVSMVIKAEEESFNNTLDRGIEIFDKLVDSLKTRGKAQLPGADAFKLYDTYGFPLDLTQLMAREAGFTVDEHGFTREMDKQRQRSRDVGIREYEPGRLLEDWQIVTKGKDSEFIGYDHLESRGTIRGFKQEGDRLFITLDKTPFYGESGGQVGDKGQLIGSDFTLDVIDTLKTAEKIIHVSKSEFPFKPGEMILKAAVDGKLRMATARNHTATHLLQAALRQVLGEHVHQSGSMVSPERLRFDLTHFERITESQLEAIERLVNENIWQNIPVEKFVTSFDDAKSMGAMALFGEKYGDNVRVVKIDDYSTELCGGTHLDTTGQIGAFRIVSESSVAAGIRRIEAITGEVAYRLGSQDRKILDSAKSLLNCKSDEIPEKIEQMMRERKRLEKEIGEIRSQQSRTDISEFVRSAIQVDNFKLAVSKIDAPSVDALKAFADALREEIKSGVGVLGAVIDNKLSFICVVTDDLIRQKKLKAGDIVREVAKITGGSGGGRPHMALAGGRDISRLNEALQGAKAIVEKMI